MPGLMTDYPKVEYSRLVNLTDTNTIRNYLLTVSRL
jgi:hypothetical protein